MNQEAISSKKVLEINPDHEIFKALKKMNDKKQDISEYANLLYNQALLLAGLQIEDPIAYANTISDLMIKAIK